MFVNFSNNKFVIMRNMVERGRGTLRTGTTNGPKTNPGLVGSTDIHRPDKVAVSDAVVHPTIYTESILEILKYNKARTPHVTLAKISKPK
jgi:hypothetical protein